MCFSHNMSVQFSKKINIVQFKIGMHHQNSMCRILTDFYINYLQFVNLIDVYSYKGI